MLANEERRRAERDVPDGFAIRAAAFLPARVAYVRQVLERLGIDPHRSQLLAVGPANGPFASQLARLGFTVAAHDPAGAGRLPGGDGVFDVAYYHDTFETTDDLDEVLDEAARVLRPGGVLLYDTVNRTTVSKLIYLRALQSWRWTRLMPRGRYTAERLRPPDELTTTMSNHGLLNQEVRSLKPASAQRLIRAILAAKRGDVDDASLARLAGMHVAERGEPPPVTYLGFASKRQPEEPTAVSSG
jgi:2-polyprenyl-6-hydroxyphenyl methylase / 3-demethylubiquinone-9 3-methyltransferase